MPHIFNSLITKTSWRLAALLIIDVGLFGNTDPQNVASYALIVAFLLLLATIYQMTLALFTVAKLYGVNIKRSPQLSAGLAGLIGVLVALQSVGELSPRDALVLLPLVGLGYLYIFYGRAAIIKP